MELYSSKHEHLRNDYKDKSGEYSASCTAVAVDLSRALEREGVEPHILIIRGEKIDTGRETLVPTAYEGRVTWGAHVVCEADGVVYDPMLVSPLIIDEYLKTAFNQTVVLQDETQILNAW